jgi:hypothetical protein
MAKSTLNRVSPVVSTEICPRCGSPPKTCTCCELVCFERPNYHCGHLLTDADLSLQVKYVVEKNKLRNRALHGNGVVCGLKLTCDPHCCDHILVHEGYAIDDCGNDIIICERVRFDVIEALRKKRLIWHERRHDPCDPCEEDPCRIKQCFYVTVCYDEEDCNFETPYQSGCVSGPQDCLPTRTREGFRLEVTDCLPEEKSYLDWLEHRLKHCFRLFRDGRCGSLMRDNIGLLRAICACRNIEEYECDPCYLFRLLKGFFIEQIKQCPDELDCRLLKEVECLCCPERDCDDWSKRLQEAYCRLFELMLRYQYDCVMSELVFGCCEPEQACCVVLGTVEVLDGRVLRVCNTPRKHVWSFANLLPLAIGAIMTGALARPRGDEDCDRDEERRHCCPDYGDFFCCETFLCELETDVGGRYKAATAILRAAREGYGALTEGFNFLDACSVSPASYRGKTMEEATRRAEEHGVEASHAEGAPHRLDPIAAILSQALLRRGDGVKFYADGEGYVRRAERASAGAKSAPPPKKDERSKAAAAPGEDTVSVPPEEPPPPAEAPPDVGETPHPAGHKPGQGRPRPQQTKRPRR